MEQICRQWKIHSWSTEGFDTPDLLEARELLEEWGRG